MSLTSAWTKSAKRPWQRLSSGSTAAQQELLTLQTISRRKKSFILYFQRRLLACLANHIWHSTYPTRKEQLLTLFPTSFHSFSSLFSWKGHGRVSRVPLANRGGQGGKLRLLSHSLPPKTFSQYGLWQGSSEGAGFSPSYHSNLFLKALI